ncbi:hypothetical protein TWF718_007109 [Orbilia javanica]|uniref:Uncharacterized protein n=1 Tax=Orbilia javanica TaxID=47235 RepID=A0AAN8MTQ7_9PEZI
MDTTMSQPSPEEIQRRRETALKNEILERQRKAESAIRSEFLERQAILERSCALKIRQLEDTVQTSMQTQLEEIDQTQQEFEEHVTVDLRMLQSRELMLGIRELILAARSIYLAGSVCWNCGRGIPPNSKEPVNVGEDPMEKVTVEELVTLSHGILTANDLTLLRISDRVSDETDIASYQNWSHLAMLLSLPVYADVREKYQNVFKWVVGKTVEQAAGKAFLLHVQPYLE